jgi:threonyl-tRNA synthetase
LQGNGITPLKFTNFRPLWLSPRQIIVIPVAHAYDRYASEVAKRFHAEGFYVEANLSSETLKKKILEAQVSQWNYILGMTLHC